MTAEVPRRLAARRVLLAKRGFFVRSGDVRGIGLRLTRRGQRMAERGGRLRVTIRVTIRGAGGRRETVSRRATIRVPADPAAGSTRGGH